MLSAGEPLDGGRLDRIGIAMIRGAPPERLAVRRQGPEGVAGQAANWPCSVQRLHCPPNPYLSTCWMVQRLTSRSLASSRWLTPFDRSTRM